MVLSAGLGGPADGSGMSDWVEIILRANTRTAPFSGPQARKTALSVTAITLKNGNHDYAITRVYEFGGAVT